MQKKIKVEDLQIGMMVVDVGRSWINHPFLTRRNRIGSSKDIQRLKDYGIREVTIKENPEGDGALSPFGPEINIFPFVNHPGPIIAIL